MAIKEFVVKQAVKRVLPLIGGMSDKNLGAFLSLAKRTAPSNFTKSFMGALNKLHKEKHPIIDMLRGAIKNSNPRVRENLAKEFPHATRILKPADIMQAREVVKEVYLDEKIENYILDIVFATRNPEQAGLAQIVPLIQYGASPRASINLAKAAKAFAFIKRRGYVVPEDVRAVCHDVLRHRIGLTYEAEAENISTENIISEILNNVEVP